MERTPHRAQVTAVVSGKGGVGKTNLALGVSIALARRGIDTILVDADFGLANLDILLDLVPRHTLLELRHRRTDVSALLCPAPGGLHVLCGVSGATTRRELSAFRPAHCVRAIDQLRPLAEQVVVDCGSGINDTVAAFALSADRLIVVTTPEPTALADGYAVLKILRSRGWRGPTKIVVNMVRQTREGLDAAERFCRTSRLFLELEVELYGLVPLDRHVADAVRARQPVVARYPRSDASLAMEAVAARLCPPPAPAPHDSGLWQRVAAVFL